MADQIMFRILLLFVIKLVWNKEGKIRSISLKSLSTKDRLEYLSDPDILPQKCVAEYMKKLGQHLLDPITEIKVGTLGGNGAAKGWDEPIPGTHAFNPGTGNDAFFADDGFKFHTGMNLNDGQRIDLEDNNNIL